MSHKKGKPRCGHTEAWGTFGGDNPCRDLRTKPATKGSIFANHYFEPHDDRPGLWIHINDDLTEVRYSRRPYKEKVLHIVDIGNSIEETSTLNLGVLRRDHFSIPVKPPGLGWWMHDASHDRTTTWRRAVPK